MIMNTRAFWFFSCKPIFLNSLLVLFSFFVGLVLMELLVQATVPVSYHHWEFNEDFGHTFMKNLSFLNRNVKYVNYSVDIKTDSQGFRNKEVPYEKQMHSKRIMVLGDSMTASVSVPSDNMYTHVLFENLNNLSPFTWEVVNRGVEDWGTDKEYIYFIKEGNK